MIDSRSIDDLHPAVARGCRELIHRMAAAGFPAVGVSSTYRCNARQDYLFAQGRTRSGPIVTNARGGQSWHNYRLAFDIFKNVRGQEWTDPNFFATAGKIWEIMGGEWGGRWSSFPDRPHFQYTGGLTLAQLQAGRRLPDDAKMLWENTIPLLGGVPAGRGGYGIPTENTISTREGKSMRYQTVEELPGWAQPAITELIHAGHLTGRDPQQPGQALDLSDDMVRILVIVHRMINEDRIAWDWDFEE